MHNAKLFSLVAAGAAAFAFAGSASAGETERCFDKGTLSYVDCPEEPKAAAPAPGPAPKLFDYDWTGAYVGGYLGYARVGYAGTFNSVPAAGQSPLFLGGLPDASLVGGGLLGFNLQYFDNLVFGLEIDGGFSSYEGDVRNAQGERASAEINYTASARARFGYSLGKVMPYVTGGASFIGWEASVTDDTGSSRSFDEVTIAPALGAGVNFWVSENVTAGAEFLYTFAYDAHSLSGITDADPGDEIELEDYWSIRGTLSYRF